MFSQKKNKCILCSAPQNWWTKSQFSSAAPCCCTHPPRGMDEREGAVREGRVREDRITGVVGGRNQQNLDGITGVVGGRNQQNLDGITGVVMGGRNQQNLH